MASPALVAVDDDPAALEDVGREPRTRYGSDRSASRRSVLTRSATGCSSISYDRRVSARAVILATGGSIAIQLVHGLFASQRLRRAPAVEGAASPAAEAAFSGGGGGR